MPRPTIGRLVIYVLTAMDALAINVRRNRAPVMPDGSRVHEGNSANEGDEFPLLITKVWGDSEHAAVNGQVFLDGNDSLWKTSVTVGEGPGFFRWPVRETVPSVVPMFGAEHGPPASGQTEDFSGVGTEPANGQPPETPET